MSIIPVTLKCVSTAWTSDTAVGPCTARMTIFARFVAPRPGSLVGGGADLPASPPTPWPAAAPGSVNAPRGARGRQAPAVRLRPCRGSEA